MIPSRASKSMRRGEAEASTRRTGRAPASGIRTDRGRRDPA
jgi:hypothetical protein